MTVLEALSAEVLDPSRLAALDAYGILDIAPYVGGKSSIAERLKLLAETGAAAMEPKQDVHDAFNARVDEANKLMAWGHPGVTSWYKNEKGRVSQNWPFLLVDYWEATRAPNPDDFVLT